MKAIRKILMVRKLSPLPRPLSSRHKILSIQTSIYRLNLNKDKERKRK
jgi:hypothetical protein